MVYAIVAARWLIALVLVGAGVAKARDHQRFLETIERYRILPTRWVSAVARHVPRLEIGVGLALAIGVFPTIAGWCACLLFSGFAVAVGLNLKRGRRFDCGCAGPGARQIGWPLVVRDVGMAFAAAAVALGPDGLQVLAGPLAGARTAVAASALVPVPLIVVAGVGLLRCVRSLNGWGFTTARGEASR